MLDTTTKAKINELRDILVGKVPDPKAQVEQITIALFYKFMWDMDNEITQLGGTPKHFTNGFEQYAWENLFAPELSGTDMLKLYGDAIQHMEENPNIPSAFRDIFKRAYLPYNDPATLKLFLKTISEFKYSHSEKLGDAFEFLLSILGTQGDAGQFRTPRHIIDFITEAVNPQKSDTICDPACGTAGFIISAYKHILKENTKDKRGDLLTPEDRKKISENLNGLDIDPMMVKLALANMYLHGFNNPHIFEYDTLTSEDRWNDHYDVILANPPFMTPKGGIRPHKRFSIQAKRSEVLFVDYIAEHLSPTGKAGVIVPEGIIFQSSNAYKALRKMLVEDYLWAVVSLPTGVFQPYSGVKTSILLMDKEKAKKADSILFIKVENDGFDLGAQRRPIPQNDLPDVLHLIRNYEFGMTLEEVEKKFLIDNSQFVIVPKSKIEESDDWNLSGERYKTNDEYQMSNYELVELGDLCNYIRGVTYSKSDEVNENGLLILRANNIEVGSSSINLAEIKQIDGNIIISEDKKLKKNDIFMCASSGSKKHIGKVAFIENNTDYYFGGFMAVLRANEKVNPKFLFENLKSDKFKKHIENSTVGANIRNLKSSIVNDFQIPLPPLPVQEEIVAEIEGYQKIIDGARQVVDNYKPTIKINPDWEMVKLGEVITLQRGHDLPKKKFIEGVYPVVGSNGIIGYHNEKKYNGPGVVTGRSGTIGKVHFIDEDYWPHNTSLFVKDFKGNEPKFILYLLQSLELKRLGERTSAVPSLDRKNAHRLKTYLPPISVQQDIVAQIEAEQEMVNANKKLIKIYEQKIKDKIGEVWGE